MRQPPFDMSTDVWTADNTWVTVSATVSFEITDPTAFANFYQAAEMTVTTALRNEIGARDLARTLDNAPEISRALPARCAALLAGHGGIRVTSVEVTGILVAPDPPPVNFTFLRNPGFSVVLRGYDRKHVDALLERAVHAMTDRPDLRAAVAREISQPVPVVLRGYDRQQVDSHFGRVSQVLSLTPGT